LPALGLIGPLGDDIDHAIDGIGAPECGSRAADNLDAVDILKDGILDVPEDAGKNMSVNAAPVNHHQQVFGELVIQPSDIDRPIRGADARDVDPWRQTQGLRDTGDARSADVVLGDDIDRRGHVGNLFRPFGGRDDLDVFQLFQGQLGEVHRLFIGSVARLRIA
jgi:hypothetical protein